MIIKGLHYKRPEINVRLKDTCPEIPKERTKHFSSRSRIPIDQLPPRHSNVPG